VPNTSVVSNPTLISGNVPRIAAASSGKVTGVPLTTPPETPRSAAGSVAGTKRDASESEKEDGNEPKKRRIAPTPVEKP
jgi:chromatin assembly factor 1 subunit B